MRRVCEILRLKHEGGASDRQIARSLNLARSAVALTLERATEAGLRWPLPATLPDRVLEAMLYAGHSSQQGARRKAEPDWDYVHDDPLVRITIRSTSSRLTSPPIAAPRRAAGHGRQPPSVLRDTAVLEPRGAAATYYYVCPTLQYRVGAAAPSRREPFLRPSAQCALAHKVLHRGRIQPHLIHVPGTKRLAHARQRIELSAPFPPPFWALLGQAP